MKSGAGGQLWILWTTRKTKKWVLERVKHETLLEAKMTKLKALPQAHHEKAWFFGKHNNAGKNRREQEKRKTHKRSHRHESAGAK